MLVWVREFPHAPASRGDCTLNRSGSKKLRFANASWSIEINKGQTFICPVFVLKGKRSRANEHCSTDAIV